MATERPFDPGLDTPTDYQPGAGQVVPGSPVDRDAQSREDADARLAEISQTESQRVAADQSGRATEERSGTTDKTAKKSGSR